MRTYELMVIHRPELAEEEVRAQVERLQETLQGQSAVVTSADFWGKRRFAYEIDHHTEGHYAVVTFDADPPAVEALNRMLLLADSVIRHKIIKPGSD